MLCDRLEYHSAHRVSRGVVGSGEQCEHGGFSGNRPLCMRAQRPPELHETMHRMRTAETIDAADDDEWVRTTLEKAQRSGQSGKRAGASVRKPGGLARNDWAACQLRPQGSFFSVVEVGGDAEHQRRLFATSGR